MKQAMTLRMMWQRLMLCLVFVGAASAQAHDAPPSEVVLDVGLGSVEATLKLPLGDLSLATQLPLALHPATMVSMHGAALERYLLTHVHLSSPENASFTSTVRSLQYVHEDGDWLIAILRLTPARADSLRQLDLDYDVIVHPVVSHNVLLALRQDFRAGNPTAELRPLATLGYQQTHYRLLLDGGSLWQGMLGMARLGMMHIAEGTDHLLFLLTLLLVAPLTQVHRHWAQIRPLNSTAWNVLRTVSGFTLGHSLTLLLGTLDLVALPSRMVETLVAISIVISAAHAIRPLFANREGWIAAGFGLIHGLAFSATLSGMGYDTQTLVWCVLAFNLGIELMQLAIVAAVLPWLIMLSRTRLNSWCRTLLALLAIVMALGWIAERALSWSNPVSALTTIISSHGSWLIGLLALISLTAWYHDARVCRCRRPIASK